MKNMSIRQIFCQHIDKEISQEVLYKTRDVYGTSFGFTTYANYVYIASYRQCLKCGRKKIIKVRGLE